MRDEKDPTDADQVPIEDSIAAQKARKALQNPRLQKSLAELRAVTPAGEPMFGFQIKTKDARAAAPKAEHIELEEGAAIITDKEAAAAYIESAAPAAGLSPRMPTGKVRLASQAPLTGGTEQRRQTTQPSLAKGGAGPRPPSLKEELGSQEEAAVPAVLDRAAPAISKPAATETASHHGPIKRQWMAPVVALLFVAAVALVVALRRPRESSAPNAATSTSAPTATQAPRPPASGSAIIATAAPSTSAAPAVIDAATSAPSVTVAPASASAIGTSTKPSAPPSPIPQATSAPSAGISPTSASTIEPNAVSTPATASPSAPPTPAPTAPPSSTTPQPASSKHGRRIADTDDEK